MQRLKVGGIGGPYIDLYSVVHNLGRPDKLKAMDLVCSSQQLMVTHAPEGSKCTSSGCSQRRGWNELRVVLSYIHHRA